MTTVNENRLKGNFGAAYVTSRLSSHCLVRPVSTDTDVGVDLYCETVEDEKPFLHFWMQVKAGSQCRVSRDATSASCHFTAKHLRYWERQPVPVFAALVPVPWPVDKDPQIYIVDVTSRLVMESDQPDTKGVTLKSDYTWTPSGRDEIIEFLTETVPTSAARLNAARHGLIASIETPQPSYVQEAPVVPVWKYQDRILAQLRRTAAQSLLFLHSGGELAVRRQFRHLLASIVKQFGDDPHWENFASRGLSHHEDREFREAVRLYRQSIDTINRDAKVRDRPEWQHRVERLRELIAAAESGERIPSTPIE